jgi:hypothetical protein
MLLQGDLVLFLRETEWGLMSYPPACHAELRLGSWELDNVLLAALVLRLARHEAATYDRSLDLQSPLGIRVLQGLSAQPQIDVYVTSDHAIRTFRITNQASIQAGQLLDQIQEREPWSAEDMERALGRLNQLYPTASDLWRGCATGARP